MDQVSKVFLREQLLKHEGFSRYPYTDTTGHITIGIGRNLTDKGISLTEANILLENDIIETITALEHYLSFYAELDEVRQIVLANMAFNLGVHGLLTFKRTLNAIMNKRYQEASYRMLQSKWARQVGKRAQELSLMMRTGELP